MKILRSLFSILVALILLVVAGLVFLSSANAQAERSDGRPEPVSINRPSAEAQAPSAAPMAMSAAAATVNRSVGSSGGFQPGRRTRAMLRRALENAPKIEPEKNPNWQQRYLLGPGDTLDFSFYKRQDLLREKVIVSPDGRVSYLQAVGVKAAGRTVGELRKEIERVLTEYHNDPKVIISPTKLLSKKITILGRVRESGVYPLDRPTTVIEAIAMAKGLEIGAVGGTALEIADLDYSFVARDGKRLNVDLSKLYYEGDFSQNAQLKPNDYIYIASSLRNRFYVLGAVKTPGQLRMPTRITLTGAIALSGGFHDEAWKRDVLLIRGSINDPETRVVNVGKILAGLEQDIIIQPKDIIYVNKRPFLIVEKALDAALTSFVQTLATESINDAYEGFFEGDRAADDPIAAPNAITTEGANAAAAEEAAAAEAVAADAASAEAALNNEIPTVTP
jgi:protein involved in polysaccharide export with SLBB domain